MMPNRYVPYQYYIHYTLDGVAKRKRYYCYNLTKNVAKIAVIRRYLQIPDYKAPQFEDELIKNDEVKTPKGTVANVRFEAVKPISNKLFTKRNTHYGKNHKPKSPEGGSNSGTGGKAVGSFFQPGGGAV